MKFLVGKEMVGTDIAKLFIYVDGKGRAQTLFKTNKCSWDTLQPNDF